MTTADLAPTADDPATVGLPRLCAGFAAVHAVLAVLALLPFTEGPGAALFVVDAGCALVFAVLGFLSGTRRLPRWRREAFVAVVPVLAVIASVTRVGLSGSAWPGAELILAAAATVLVTSRPLLIGVLATSAAGLVTATVLDGVREGFTGQLAERWVHLGLLLAACTGLALAVRRSRLASSVALVEAHRTLLENSVRDPLTGLANRKGLAMFSRPMIDLARRQGQAVHCLVVDVDTLREVNEEHGMHDGDAVLLAVAAALSGAVRTTDVVARWGGDEFVLLGPGTGVSPLEMERRVRVHLAQTEGLPRGAWQGRVSAGSATLVPWDGDDLDGLLHRAEQDLALRRSLKRRAAARMQADDESARTVPAPGDLPTSGTTPDATPGTTPGTASGTAPGTASGAASGGE